jgi:hypothetical protein
MRPLRVTTTTLGLSVDILRAGVEAWQGTEVADINIIQVETDGNEDRSDRRCGRLSLSIRAE